jgi:hypothetical protein
MLGSHRPFCLLTAAILLLAGCGNAGSKNPGTFNPAGTAQPQTATVATATPTPQTDAEINAAALEQYKKFQETYRTVYQTGDPAPLADVAVDPILSVVTKDVRATYAKHEIWRFTTVLNPKVGWRSEDRTSVLIYDCIRTLSAWKFSTKTGKRLGGGPGGTHVYRARLRYDGIGWKVAEGLSGKKC